jgi:hypothetical protein
MPQATHKAGSTTASRSKGRPSLLGCMVTALKGQSSAQRVQPLQLARSTLATGTRRIGGSQGSAATIRLSVVRKTQRAPLDQMSMSG